MRAGVAGGSAFPIPPRNATVVEGSAQVDELIGAIKSELTTFTRDFLIGQVWKAVRDDIVYVPLHHQVIIWAMRDDLDLPVDAQNWPRFRLARLGRDE